MDRSLFTAVDDYLNERIVGSDSALDATLQSITKNGLPEINVTAPQAKFLAMLVSIHGSQRVLEIGTLAGYSAIWMGRALPKDGRLITLEFEEKHARIAKENIARAGLSSVIDVRLGAALDNLPKIEAERLGPFDFFFIDADKVNNPNYFEWALRLSRPGSVIVVDNVVRAGKIVDANSTEESVRGTRALFDRLATEKRVRATAIQTVGSKGYDGFVLATVTQ